MSGIDENIRKAMEDGKFDDLPGKGKPLNLEENPFEDPNWRLANHVLKVSGFSPPWIETRQEIVNLVAQARELLTRAWVWRVEALVNRQSLQEIELEWQRAANSFQEQTAQINKRIRDFNLSAPSERFHLPMVNPEREIKHLTHLPDE